MKKQIITLAVTGLLLSSCGIYTKYEPVTSIPDQLYGGEVVTEDTASLGNMDWRELFTDPYLQSLIEVGLQTNTDYQSAQLRVEEAQATNKFALPFAYRSCSRFPAEQEQKRAEKQVWRTSVRPVLLPHGAGQTDNRYWSAIPLQ